MIEHDGQRARVLLKWLRLRLHVCTLSSNEPAAAQPHNGPVAELHDLALGQRVAEVDAEARLQRDVGHLRRVRHCRADAALLGR
eukprot:667989-Lingulodinium_polyedra.AAC.1